MPRRAARVIRSDHRERREREHDSFATKASAQSGDERGGEGELPEKIGRMLADLIEAEEAAAREEERENPGLLDVPEVAIEDPASRELLSADQEERLIADERIVAARPADQREDEERADERDRLERRDAYWPNRA